jgi:2',3'-cyclic-nucleotide 2'-phosphodiesterase (5'-nucleotidase family)
VCENLATTPMSTTQARLGGPTLRIVAVNDVYSLENLARLRTLVEHHRRADAADVFLVTLAGDFVAPSLLSSLDAGRGMVECMKMIGVTHAIFGNHEDDIPTPALRKRIDELGASSRSRIGSRSTRTMSSSP